MKDIFTDSHRLVMKCSSGLMLEAGPAASSASAKPLLVNVYHKHLIWDESVLSQIMKLPLKDTDSFLHRLVLCFGQNLYFFDIALAEKNW